MPKLTIEDLEKITQRVRKETLLREGAGRAKITVHMGTCGIAAGAEKIKTALLGELEKRNIKDVLLTYSGCAGLCSKEPMVTVELLGETPVKYADLTAEKISRILSEHVIGGKPVREYALEGDSFFSCQRLIVLRNRGLIDPEKIDEYIARNGYRALAKILTAMTPADIIEQIKKSGLRGRGGGGFPTGEKWQLCRNCVSKTTQQDTENSCYIICNADEGDPGAYMDRSIVESDPHSVLEGMLIAARAIEAREGFIYIRAEYPLALKTLEVAIQQAKDYGLLGENIFDTDFSFDIHIKQGAGAFVCGEETSLIASIEGHPPEPVQRPPYPVETGLWGKPTNVNNVETFANVAPIINRGAEWFAGIGTEKSKGTKVFSLVGKVANTGLVEVPMGITLRQIVYDVGGGTSSGKNFKAVQTGGPSGGCVPASMADLPVDYEKLTEVGAIMGSGGMIVMDEDTCMVDVAKYFIEFTSQESCGKCSCCREGSIALLEILERICSGQGLEEDIELLEEISYAVKDASLCGLGQTLPNPVLSGLNHFKDEYKMHIKEKKCPAKVCKGLIEFSIDEETCTGCTACVKVCPTEAVSGVRKEPHKIDQDKCIKCGVCSEVCKFGAVKVE
jgi:NADH-quinone oxidoreductase subunit F/NADP-reducing hydrogenase subunit HndC